MFCKGGSICAVFVAAIGFGDIIERNRWMKKFFKLRKEKDTKIKEDAIRNAMISYYNTINRGKVALPSFILAEIAIKRNKAFDRLDELYAVLEN